MEIGVIRKVSEQTVMRKLFLNLISNMKSGFPHYLGSFEVISFCEEQNWHAY